MTSGPALGALRKRFRTTGPCVPGRDYMVDRSATIATIVSEYIAPGEYFTINRGRQYGKTTTLGLLETALMADYVPIRTSFEGWGIDAFANAGCSCRSSSKRPPVLSPGSA